MNMSYCRFSSMNFMCDVYVYEDVYGGWTIHVAGNRHIFPPIPKIPWSWMPRLGSFDHASRRVVYAGRFTACVAWVLLHVFTASDRLHMWSVGVIPRKAIGLPHDGAQFNDESPAACVVRLEELRAIGYNVPQRAIDALREECAP